MIGIFTKVKTKLQKRKERLNRKEIRNPYLAPRRSQPTPAQPAHRGRGVFFPAPRTQAARWNATEPAGRPPRHLPAWSLPGILIAPWRRTRVPRLHFPPPELSPLPLPLVSSPPKKHAGAPSNPRVAIDVKKPSQGVQGVRRCLLHRPAKG